MNCPGYLIKKNDENSRNFRNYKMSCVLIAINLLTNINFLEIFHEFYCDSVAQLFDIALEFWFSYNLRTFPM